MHTEAIITSLVFDHALRIRIKAETSHQPKIASLEEPASTAHDHHSKPTHTDAGSAEEEDAETVHSRTTTAVSTATAATSSTAVAPDESQAKATDATKAKGEVKEHPEENNRNNLIGKVNNLVTSDLDNITNGRDFLFFSKHSSNDMLLCILIFCTVFNVPVNITFGMIFLYVVLGWRYTFHAILPRGADIDFPLALLLVWRSWWPSCRFPRR